MNLNESLEKSQASTKKQEHLRNISDVQDFKKEFGITFDTAADIWLSDKRWKKLMVFSRTHDFMCISGESENGIEERKTKKLLDEGWEIFDSEQNYDNFDCILMKRRY